jgi:hypothetical protein
VRFRIRRPWLSAIWTLVFAPVIAVLTLSEWNAVDREVCRWGTDEFCTEYKGLYGLAAAILAIVLILALLVVNRDRSSGYRS